MATIRRQVWLDHSAATAWKIVGRPDRVATWFPSIASCTVEGTVRTCQLERGGQVVEQIVMVDDDLRRLQYRVLDGLAIERHLATVDVVEAGDRRCLVLYGTDVEPDRLAAPLTKSIDAALARLADVVHAGEDERQ
jgi:hypothetical protein